MNEILFVVQEAEDGSYRADAVGQAIHTEADSLERRLVSELGQREIRPDSTSLSGRIHFEDGHPYP